MHAIAHKRCCVIHPDAPFQQTHPCYAPRATPRCPTTNSVWSGRSLRLAERIVADARIERDWVAATGALREARNCVELLARLRGELQSTSGVQVGVAVNVAGSVHATNEELDRMIAVRVSEATRGFNPQEIERLREIAETTTS